jgi:hypothetical protein
MKERPMLFSAPMVRAIRAGTKTQTRRVVKGAPLAASSYLLGLHRPSSQWGIHADVDGDAGVWRGRCPYGQAGGRLWVRETWSTHACFDNLPPRDCPKSIHYTADGPIQTGKGRPSIHMPRWASRITLEITGVRVERLQDISDEDLRCEGLQEIIDAGVDHDGYSRDAWRALWTAINGPESWAANPWVWAIEFTPTK